MGDVSFASLVLPVQIILYKYTFNIIMLEKLAIHVVYFIDFELSAKFSFYPEIQFVYKLSYNNHLYG